MGAQPQTFPYPTPSKRFLFSNAFMAKSGAQSLTFKSVTNKQTEEIAPFLTALFNRSMSAGHFSAAFKDAFITPALQKPGLDVTNVQSYRPISNLSVVSKLLERIVARQLNSYLMSANLLPSLASIWFSTWSLD